MKYKLLIAEADPSERLALCSILTKQFGASITVFEAANGTEALDLFFQEAPDIAILNIEIPHHSGLEVAQTIRKSSRSCALLFISNHDSFSYARQAIALRALDFILKPYEESKLILSVEEAIQYVSHFENPAPESVRSRPAGSTAEETEDARLSLVREDITSFIESHYMEELSMKNAADAMNYSDAYFCKLFKQCFHVNFSTYLNEYRIQKAKDMMENPRINVKDVGLACGYADSNYFSRVFKRVTGQTPTEYRLAVMEKSLKK